jgi:cytochrome c oxidase subunit 2
MFNLPVVPEQASEFAAPYDALFWATTALTIFFTVVVMLMLFVFCIRYRRGSKVSRRNALTSHMLLEMTWMIVPTVLGLMMFFWAAYLFVEQRIPPKDAMEVYVVGKQWMWHLQHPNGVRENNELHVPVGKPVKLIMISQDVLHSFFVPAFRMKQDVIPGRYTMQWFKATKTGKYPLFCTEYCGTQHSEMGGYVYVLSPPDYERWLAAGGQKLEMENDTPLERGKALWERLACGNCHTEQDTERGPTLNGLIGSKRKMADGQVLVADRNYIREAILDPYPKLTAGYEMTMPEYKTQLTEEQVLDLYEYVRSLGVASTSPKVASTGGGKVAMGDSTAKAGREL